MLGLFHFWIIEPYFIFGWMNLISYSDEWTLFHFRMNEPYFIFGVTNTISFSDLWTLFHFRRIEPSDKWIFGLTNPISFSDKRTFGTTSSTRFGKSKQFQSLNLLWDRMKDYMIKHISLEKWDLKTIINVYNITIKMSYIKSRGPGKLAIFFFLI